MSLSLNMRGMRTSHLALFFILSTLLFSSGCASIADKFKKNKPQDNAVQTTENSTVKKAHDTKTPQSQKREPQKTQALANHKKPKPSVRVSPAQTDLWFEMRNNFKLPVLKNKRVAYYENRFTRHPKHFYAMLSRAEWFLPYILAEIKKRKLPAELALLPAVESAFIPDARSHSNASGLWQFIPSTGKIFKLKQNRAYDGRRDPVLATQAALDFLEQLETRFDGNWFHAIAAYNAGGWTVEKAINKNKKRGKPSHFNHLSLRKETKDYVPKLIAYRNIILNPHRYGLSLPKMTTTLKFASLDAGVPTDLSVVAKLANVSNDTIRFLNKAYKQGTTPVNGPHIIHLPIESLNLAKTRLAKLAKNERRQWLRHTVKKGEIIGRIANRYGVSVASIKQSNHLKSNMIYVGKTLLIPSNNIKKSLASAKKKTSSSTSSITHRVRRGDTLWDIAKRYGVKVAQISKWNQISKASTLKLGQRLRLYPL